MRKSQIVKVLAVALPLAVTALLWFLSKRADEGAMLELTAVVGAHELAGLFAVVMMAIALLITARSRIFEAIYGGLDKSYRLHARLGEVALVLVLVHVTGLIPGTRHVSTLFIPFTTAWWKSCGILALWMFVVVAPLTYLKRIPYQRWLSIHRWIGVPFLLAGVHTMASTADVKGFEPLRTWMLLWVTLGAGAWLYRTFIYSAAGPRHDYKVEGVTERGNGTWDLVLRPTTVRMNYEPGKFAFISVRDSAQVPAEHHPFSISSSPVQRDLRFSYKALGDFTGALRTVPAGTPVEVYGPFGQFTLHQLGEFRRLVWIAGGIGVTPFLSMLAFETTNDDFRRIWFFYSVRREEDAVYDKEIRQQIEHADSYVDYVKWVSTERGELSAESILAHTGPIPDYAIMICGPPAMARALKQQFIRKGFRPNRIVYEDFSFR